MGNNRKIQLTTVSYTYLKEREEDGRQKGIFHPLAHSLYSVQQLKLGQAEDRSSVLVSQLCGGNPAAWSIFHCFPLGIRSEAAKARTSVQASLPAVISTVCQMPSTIY